MRTVEYEMNYRWIVTEVAVFYKEGSRGSMVWGVHATFPKILPKV